MSDESRIAALESRLEKLEHELGIQQDIEDVRRLYCIYMWPDIDLPPDAPTTWYHPFPEAGVLQYHYPNPVTGEMPREVLDPTHYWKGNWPGEFGQTGHL